MFFRQPSAPRARPARSLQLRAPPRAPRAPPTPTLPATASTACRARPAQRRCLAPSASPTAHVPWVSCHLAAAPTSRACSAVLARTMTSQQPRASRALRAPTRRPPAPPRARRRRQARARRPALVSAISFQATAHHHYRLLRGRKRHRACLVRRGELPEHDGVGVRAVRGQHVHGEQRSGGVLAVRCGLLQRRRRHRLLAVRSWPVPVRRRVRGVPRRLLQRRRGRHRLQPVQPRLRQQRGSHVVHSLHRRKLRQHGARAAARCGLFAPLLTCPRLPFSRR